MSQSQHPGSLVSHLAHLARLKLTPEEEGRLGLEFRAIVAFVDQVERVQATLQPLTATITGVRHVVREDTVVPSTLAGPLLSQAPEITDGCVRVPPVR